MLREILIVRQDDPSARRRWFESDYFDLFVWQDLSGTFTGFQLCYEVERNERALVWNLKNGFFHDGVDSGGYGRALGLFVPDGKFDSGTVVPRLTEEAAEISSEVRDFVLSKIREHLIEQHRVRGQRKRVRREDWQRRQAGAAKPGEN